MRMWCGGQPSVDCVTLSSWPESRWEKVTNVFLWPTAAKSGHMTPAMTWHDMTWRDMTWHDTGAMLPLVSVVSLLSVSPLVMETSASLVAGNNPHYCDKIAEMLYWQYKFVDIFILFYSNVQIVQPIKRFKRFSTTCVYVLNVLVLCPCLFPRGSALMVPFRLFAVLCRIEKSEDWPTYLLLMKWKQQKNSWRIESSWKVFSPFSRNLPNC